MKSFTGGQPGDHNITHFSQPWLT